MSTTLYRNTIAAQGVARITNVARLSPYHQEQYQVNFTHISNTLRAKPTFYRMIFCFGTTYAQLRIKTT